MKSPPINRGYLNNNFPYSSPVASTSFRSESVWNFGTSPLALILAARPRGIRERWGDKMANEKLDFLAKVWYNVDI